MSDDESEDEWSPKDLVGLDLQAAQLMAFQNGKTLRVQRVDGKTQPGAFTRDRRPNRIDISLKDEKVVQTFKKIF